MKEKLYIIYRIIKAKLSSLLFYAFRIFPIDNKLVTVCTFEGKGGFGCNPKYIIKELNKQRPDVKIVWFLNKDVMDKKMPRYVKKVPNTLLSRAYWLTRSKVWIDNYRKPYGTVKRKGQYYLNSNHYTIAIKTVGMCRGNGFSKIAYLVSKNDSDMIDDLIIDSKFGEVMCPKGLLFNGPYLKTGAPRCDVLYGNRDKIKKWYRKKNNIPKDAKIVLYAPTFREGAKDGKRFVYSKEDVIYFSRLLDTLEDKMGGTWYLCIRLHPQLASMSEEYENSELQGRIINETKADDLYVIMAAMDAYITDYSSACFEAGFAKIPTFIYADDIMQYENDRGALFWNMATDPLEHVQINKKILKGLNVELPFPIATTNDELENVIRSFDQKKYEDRLCKFNNAIGLVFDGNASKRIAKVICDNLAE